MPDDEGLDSIELCEVYRKLPWTPVDHHSDRSGLGEETHGLRNSLKAEAMKGPSSSPSLVSGLDRVNNAMAPTFAATACDHGTIGGFGFFSKLPRV